MFFQSILAAFLAALTFSYLAMRFLVHKNATKSIPVRIQVTSQRRRSRPRRPSSWR